MSQLIGLKILFVFSGPTHYYNYVLSRLNHAPGIEVVVLFPKEHSVQIGAGVKETFDGAEFQIRRLQEIRWLGRFPAFRGFWRLLLKERPDVVVTVPSYTDSLFLNPLVRLVKTSLGIRFVLKSIPFQLLPYDEAKTEFRGRSFLRKLKGFPLFWLQKWAFSKGFDGHVNYIQDAYRIYGSYGVDASRIFVTGNSPDTDRLFAAREKIEADTPILPQNHFRLIHVGRLVDWKRVDLLIEAVAILKSRFPKLELIVVGEGPLKPTLIEQSTRLGLVDSVRFVGGVYEPEHLGRYLRASAVYVLAGMGGLSINDAMAFGLPVICSVCDGTEKDLVRDGANGYFFKSGDLHDLEEKISKILDSPELRERMGEESTRIIRDEINIQRVISGYVRAFAALCGEG